MEKEESVPLKRTPIDKKELEKIELWIEENRGLIINKSVEKHNFSSGLCDYLESYDSKNPFFNLPISQIMILTEEMQQKDGPELYGGEPDGWFNRAGYSSIRTGGNANPSKEKIIGLAIGFALKNPLFANFVEACGYSFPSSTRDLVVMYFVDKSPDYDTATKKDKDLVNRNLSKLNSYIYEVASHRGESWKLIDSGKTFTDD